MSSYCSRVLQACFLIKNRENFFSRKCFASSFGRVFTTYSSSSASLCCTAEKIKGFFKEYKHLFLFAGISSLSALADPVLFFSSLLAGSIGTLALAYVSEGPGFPDIFIKKSYEYFIAQTTFAAINGACQAVQTINNHYIFHVWKDGSISTMFSGVLVGATIVAIGNRMLFGKA